MNSLDNNYLSFCIYNYSRYIFLKLENEYENFLSKFNITLPQLRCLWIIKSFPKISVSKISQIGWWSVPTVTNMLKLLEEKNYIKKSKLNNKQFSITLTNLGEEIIKKTKLNKNTNLPIIQLINSLEPTSIDMLISFYSHVLEKEQVNIIYKYTEHINNHSLKIDINSFEPFEKNIIKKIIILYNLLRVFVLSIQKEHTLYLKNLDLTYPQIRALKLIEAFPNINSLELSQLGFWSHSTANLISKNLYKKGLINKTKANTKNTIELTITEKGENLIRQDIAMNIIKISYIKTLIKSSNEDLIRVYELLIKISKGYNIEIIHEIVDKTYSLNSLH